MNTAGNHALIEHIIERRENMKEKSEKMKEIVIMEEEYQENNPEHIDRMLKKNSTLIIAVIVTLLPMALGIYYYDNLPDQVAIHFSFGGNPNSYMSKMFGILIPPAVMAIVEIAIFRTRKISRKKGRGGVNLKGMHLMLWLIALMSVFVNASIIYYNLGIKMDIVKIGCILCGVVLTALGNYIPKESFFPKEYMSLPKSLKGSERKIRNALGRTLVIVGLLSIVFAFINGKIAGCILICSGVLIIAELIYFMVINKKMREYEK